MAIACADDGKGLTTGEDPVMVGDCPCRLEVKFENLAICASPTTPSAPAHVFSSSWDVASKRPVCDAWAEPQPVPDEPWSRTIEVKSACTGSAQLCLVLKAGDAKALSAEDCELTRRCGDLNYGVAEATQLVGSLPGWVGTTACAARYEQLGGYLEFTVASSQLGCGTGEVERLQICPSRCNDNPLGAGCDTCGDGAVVTTF
jgi:hypothetical protein